MARPWTVAAAVGALYLLAYWSLDAGSGLARSVVLNASGGREVEARRVPSIDLGDLAGAAGASGVTLEATWRGAWTVPDSGLYDLALASRGRSSWTIDGHSALETNAGDARRTVWLVGGVHRIDITYAGGSGAPQITAGSAKAGEEPDSLTGLRPEMPNHPRWRVFGNRLRSLAGWLALVSIVLAIRATVADRRDAWRRRLDGIFAPRTRAAIGRALTWTALAAILAHGALLRLDAITARYGPVSSPRWLAALQTRPSARPGVLRPEAMQWEPELLHPHRDGPPTRYFSDPYVYLDDARHMTSFYAAHFREPVFPFVTRMWLHVLDGQDVAVSFASAFCSVLAIWLTYVLGAAVWSRPVGLLAALGFSLDSDVVSHASLGYRDDAYVAVVALCAYAMLRCLRSDQRPAARRRLGRLRIDGRYLEAAALGVAAAIAVLTRFMAVTLLAAGFSCLIVALRGSWRRRLTTTGIATATAVIVAAPYFVNCWRVYGDPLYTFNVHGNIYSAAEGQTFHGSTATYVLRTLAARPVDTIETVGEGLTIYPFDNKWQGLDVWHADVGAWASIAALIGMVALASSAGGRLLLIAIAGSLIPFSLTWKIDGNYRFTEFVYPALLIAAGVTVDVVFRAVRAALVPRPSGVAARRWTPSWRLWAVVGAGAVVLWCVTRVSPSWTFRETLRANETAMATAGARDAGLLDRGWSDVVHAGDVVSLRVALADGWLTLPLPASGDYLLSVRMDPFPRPLDRTTRRLPVVDVSLNGAPLTTVALQWTFDRVGTYDIVLPRSLTRAGANRLDFHVRRPAGPPPDAVEPGLSDGDAISLWRVRVTPR